MGLSVRSGNNETNKHPFAHTKPTMHELPFLFPATPKQPARCFDKLSKNYTSLDPTIASQDL